MTKTIDGKFIFTHKGEDYVPLEDYVKLFQEKEQLKEVIDQIREYIKENRLFQFEYDSEYSFLGISDEKPRKELLQILDKVGESNE